MLLPHVFQKEVEFVSLSLLVFSYSQSEDGTCGPVLAQLGKGRAEIQVLCLVQEPELTPES